MPNQCAALDRTFQALADPSRRRMLERLGAGPASVGELAEPLAMSLPSVLQHLQLLEASGLIRSEKLGRVRTCRLEPAALEQVEAWVAARRGGWQRRFDRLGDYLAEAAPETSPAPAPGLTQDRGDDTCPTDPKPTDQ